VSRGNPAWEPIAWLGELRLLPQTAALAAGTFKFMSLKMHPGSLAHYEKRKIVPA
jgi:hypothetical protein